MQKVIDCLDILGLIIAHASPTWAQFKALMSVSKAFQRAARRLMRNPKGRLIMGQVFYGSREGNMTAEERALEQTMGSYFGDCSYPPLVSLALIHVGIIGTKGGPRDVTRWALEFFELENKGEIMEAIGDGRVAIKFDFREFLFILIRNDRVSEFIDKAITPKTVLDIEHYLSAIFSVYIGDLWAATQLDRGRQIRRMMDIMKAPCISIRAALGGLYRDLTLFQIGPPYWNNQIIVRFAIFDHESLIGALDTVSKYIARRMISTITILGWAQGRAAIRAIVARPDILSMASKGDRKALIRMVKENANGLD